MEQKTTLRCSAADPRRLELLRQTGRGTAAVIRRAMDLAAKAEGPE